MAITYSGTALPVANGGTGLTTLTAGYIPYGAGTSAFGSSANLFWDSANSYLGIGTASPGTKLTVNSGSSGADSARFTDGVNSTLLVRHSSGGIASLDAYSTFTLMLGGSEQMRLNSTGLGIGTASPNYKLDVNGAIVNGINGAYGAYTRISGGTLKPYFATSGNDTFYYNTNASGSIKWVNATDTATLMTLDNSGNLTNIGVFKGNSGSKGFGGITTTTSTSTPTGGSSGDHYYIY